ncbi:hypothetical protein JTB14_030132 [Gonioctena quinquepunctata]|nr:hypothetical protein JTB14_030132 [Gonioctena quinquepunctata]
MQLIIQIPFLDMERKQLEFDTLEDFETWLLKFSEENNVRYLRNEKNNILYYSCNRSGKYQDKGIKRNRALKSQGSCKVGHMCTSQIVVKNDNGVYSVIFYGTHYGHNTEVQHVRITKDNRTKIAAKLADGVPLPKILDSNRQSFHMNSLSRVNLLTRKDINNIRKSFKIANQEDIPPQAEPTDALNEGYDVDGTQILFYKQPNDEHPGFEIEDYCLIIMNRSQKLMLKEFGNNVITMLGTDGLFTMMVSDEFGEEFPGACMYTNRTDISVFTLLFQIVAEHTGQINTKFFISDELSGQYDAWQNVMGPVPNHFTCTTNTDQIRLRSLGELLNEDTIKGISSLLKYIRDKTVERIIKLTKGKNTTHIRLTHSNHRIALTKWFAFVTIPDVSDSWTILTDTENFIVSKNVHINLPCCQLKCTFCNVCIHAYSCTCKYFCVNSIMCVHIHYMVLHTLQKIDKSVQKDINKSHVAEEVAEHLQSLSNSNGNWCIVDCLPIQIDDGATETWDLTNLQDSYVLYNVSFENSNCIVENENNKVS